MSSSPDLSVRVQHGAVLTASHLTVAGATRVLIRDAEVSLSPGQRVGLVGRNGGGKTTLLQLFAAACAGSAPPAHVSIEGTLRAHQIRAGLLPQHPSSQETAGSVAEYLNTAAGEVAVAFARQEQLSEQLSLRPSETLILAHAEAVDRLTALRGWDLDSRRAEVLTGLGIDQGALWRPLRTLSGGESTRVALAGLLLAAPDLLLLDEPTNNLDNAGIEYLHTWLRDSPAAAVVVSHDRDFLDTTITEVLEIDEFDESVSRVGGNYSFFLQTRDDEFESQHRAYVEQQNRRTALLRSAGQLAARGQNFQSQSNNDFYRARGKKVARRATVQLARIRRQLSDLDEPQPPRRPRIVVPSALGTPGRLLIAEDIAIAHPGATPLLDNVTVRLSAGERIGITGPNGSGKTTLLRTLLGDLQPHAGTVWRRPGMQMASLDQSRYRHSPSRRAVDHVREVAPLSESKAREIIGMVLFSDVGERPLDRLSAGEQRRVELVALFAARPELIALDEPTNHLDLLSIEMLEAALDEYTGALLLVSHDARFLRQTRLGTVLHVDGAGSVSVGTTSVTP